MPHQLDFIIPLRIDSQDRVDNCKSVLRFLNIHFPESDIYIIEHDKESRIHFYKDYHRTIYQFIQSEGRFSKSETINYGLSQSKAKWIAVYDTDVIIQPQAIRQTIDYLKSHNRFHVAIPHNLIFVNIKGTLKKELMDTLNLSAIPFYKLGETSNNPEVDVFQYELPAGIVIFNRKTLYYYGGYNRKMISYGYEDLEVLQRLEKLGYPWYVNPDFNLIHYDHIRGADSQQNEFYQINEKECTKVSRMNPVKLLSYINRELSYLKGKKRILQSCFQMRNLYRIGYKIFSFLKRKILKKS